ncbi:MAG: sulfite exporter TauE/SafE family protein [Bacteroidetes bacterium]|nr:MAG: sulfite exporter TauE/SafE family protein [Bacteroidota bacterium]
MELHEYLIAIIGGALAGGINTLAGNGSAITLTILTEILHLPGNLANGTNRVGIMMQSSAATWAFYKNGRLNWAESRFYIFLTVIGAIAGVLVATQVSNAQFRSVFRFLMVFMLLVVLVKPKRWLRVTDTSNPPSMWVVVPAFLFLGFYGGFIQMGMGIIFLAVMVLGVRWSLIDSNVIKSFIVASYTIFVIAIFQYKGLIDWKIGAVLAIGQTAGGWFAAQFASKHRSADIWAYRLLVVMMFLAVGKLFNVHEWVMAHIY